MTPAPALVELIVADETEWRSWLEEHHALSPGRWLVLAKKGTTEPTSLSYDLALDEALCFGWIDGQIRRRDSATFAQRFTPRRSRSQWSRRNVGLVDRLSAEGRMRAAGVTQVDAARSDGRWAAAYDGQAAAQVPDDLSAAFDCVPGTRSTFDALDGANRYAILYRIQTARTAETRARRVAELVAMVGRKETIHPLARRRSS